MELQYYGANCLALTYKQVRIVIDDNLKSLGLKSITKPTDICLYTSSDLAEDKSNSTARIVIDSPGEYEVGRVSVYGIEAQAHMDEPKQHTASIYKMIVGDLNIIVTGHIYPELTDNQLEAIGMVDVLIIPVGGHGYTVDSIGALKLIKLIEPKIVIPTHYADSTIQYPVPQDSLEDVLKNISMEPSETISKLKLKSADLTEGRKLIVLEKTN